MRSIIRKRIIREVKNSPETLKKRSKLRRFWKNTIPKNSFPLYIEKICKDCKEKRLCRWMSSFTQTGKPEYKARCNDCHNALLRKRAKKNRKRMNLQAKERKRQYKEKYVNYLGGKCQSCGYSKSLRALTFHHRNPKEKDRDISQMIDWSWEKVRQELDKCDLLCFNCHMEIHDDRD